MFSESPSSVLMATQEPLLAGATVCVQTQPAGLGGPLPLRILAEQLGRAPAQAQTLGCSAYQGTAAVQGWACYLPPQLYRQMQQAHASQAVKDANAACGSDGGSPHNSHASTSCSARTHSGTSSRVTSEPADSEDSDSEAGSASAPESAVAGRVWTLSQDAQGSRQVQAALDAAPHEQARQAIARELEGHVAKAMRCPHGNHTLQKIISTMRPENLNFMISELVARPGLAAQAARHRYGCRVVQQLLKKCPPEQIRCLSESLLADVVVFACHPFGGYVVQHLLEFGAEDQRRRLSRTLEQNVGAVGRTGPGCGVLASALTRGSEEDRIWLARAVTQEPELLLALAHSRHGNLAVVALLQMLSGREEKKARATLLANIDELRASRYGRVVAEALAPGEAGLDSAAGSLASLGGA